MGVERHGSNAGGDLFGGLLKLFDWNTKSRKKLFSTKSSIPELSKQKKRCDQSLPITLLHMVDEVDALSGSSVKGSSGLSCTSSLTDEEFVEPRPPGIVARLMGLDSLPRCDVPHTRSTTYFDTQSLPDLHLQPQNLESQQQYHLTSSGNLQEKMEAPVRNAMEPKHQRTSNKPIKKFQTEKLPPKSGKMIPITRQKLLLPIKSANYIPSIDAARIMEAADRIVRPGPQATTKDKLPLLASSSVTLKVRDRKEKVEAAQKTQKPAEVSRRPHESYAFKYFKGESLSKSWSGSTDTTSVKGSVDSGDCAASTKGKGKSISLALQAKSNVQKRQSLSSRGRKTLVVTAQNEVISSDLFEGQLGTQKGTKKKPSPLGSSNIKNNQKQNSHGDSRKLPSRQSMPNSLGEKPVNGNSSIAGYTYSTKSTGNKAVRRLSSEAIDGRNKDIHHNTRNTSCKKWSKERNFHADCWAVNHDNLFTNKNKKPTQSQPNKRQGTEVVSFTFTSPMMRSDCGPESFTVQEENIGLDFRGIQSLPNKDGINSPKFSVVGCNVIGGDALSTLLDQKLRELTHGLATSVNKVGKGGTSPSSSHGLRHGLDGLQTMTISHAHETKDLRQIDEIASRFKSVFSSDDFHNFTMKTRIQGLNQEVKKYVQNDVEVKAVLKYRISSPISVLEHSFFAESCNSSDTANSSTTGDSKQSPLAQAEEANVELSDSASSLSAPGFAAKQVLTSSLSDLTLSTQLELAYVKKIVHDIDQTFEYFAAGKTSEFINPQLFLQSECQDGDRRGHLPLSRRKALFDCVAECLEKRCQQHVGGGYKAWVESQALAICKDRLAVDVFKEISGLSNMGDYMVDELVDKDMSNKYGRWLDFEIESFELGIHIENRILEVLLVEVIADIL